MQKLARADKHKIIFYAEYVEISHQTDRLPACRPTLKENLSKDLLDENGHKAKRPTLSNGVLTDDTGSLR